MSVAAPASAGSTDPGVARSAGADALGLSRSLGVLAEHGGQPQQRASKLTRAVVVAIAGGESEPAQRRAGEGAHVRGEPGAGLADEQPVELVEHGGEQLPDRAVGLVGVGTGEIEQVGRVHRTGHRGGMGVVEHGVALEDLQGTDAVGDERIAELTRVVDAVGALAPGVHHDPLQLAGDLDGGLEVVEQQAHVVGGSVGPADPQHDGNGPAAPEVVAPAPVGIDRLGQPEALLPEP